MSNAGEAGQVMARVEGEYYVHGHESWVMYTAVYLVENRVRNFVNLGVPPPYHQPGQRNRRPLPIFPAPGGLANNPRYAIRFEFYLDIRFDSDAATEEDFVPWLNGVLENNPPVGMNLVRRVPGRRFGPKSHRSAVFY